MTYEDDGAVKFKLIFVDESDYATDLLAGRKIVVQYEQPRHCQSGSHSSFCERPHGALIVRNDNPVVFGSPLENIWVRCSVKVHIPDVEEVCGRDMQLDLDNDFRVNVLVCK